MYFIYNFRSSAPLTIEQVFYVSPLGNDNDSGSESNPFRSIQYAIDKIASSKVSDKILLMPGDFHLTSAIEVNGISEITIEAQNKSDPPRLLRWGIELLSGPNYLQYVKLDTIIFESSRALRISGLLQRIVITKFVYYLYFSNFFIKLSLVHYNYKLLVLLNY